NASSRPGSRPATGALARRRGGGRAVSAPIPRAGPVTRTTRPASSYRDTGDRLVAALALHEARQPFDRAVVLRHELLVIDLHVELPFEEGRQMEDPDGIQDVPLDQWVVVRQLVWSTRPLQLLDDERPDPVVDGNVPPSRLIVHSVPDNRAPPRSVPSCRRAGRPGTLRPCPGNGLAGRGEVDPR